MTTSEKTPLDPVKDYLKGYVSIGAKLKTDDERIDQLALRILEAGIRLMKDSSGITLFEVVMNLLASQFVMSWTGVSPITWKQCGDLPRFNSPEEFDKFSALYAGKQAMTKVWARCCTSS